MIRPNLGNVSYPYYFVENNILQEDYDEVAISFYTFLVNIGLKLAQNIPFSLQLHKPFFL